MAGVMWHPRRKVAPNRAATIYNWIIALGILAIVVLCMHIDNERKMAEKKHTTNPAATVTAK